MSNETTSTTVTSRIRSEHIGAVARKAHTPKSVVTPLVNYASLAGLPTLTYQHTPEADLGPASAGTEGTEITANTELTYDSAVTFTVTEGALVRSLITIQAMERQVPGLDTGGLSPFDILNSMDYDAQLALLASYGARQLGMAAEKLEDDLLNLATSFSNTVGGGAAVDLSISDIIAAMFQHEAQNPVAPGKALVLYPHQIRELRDEAGVTNGGFGGSVWTAQGDLSFFNDRADISRRGFAGTLLGIPVYQAAHDLRTESGNAAYGALMTIPSNEAARNMDDPSPEYGAWAMVEGNQPRWFIESSAPNRGVILVLQHEFITGELDDLGGVAIVSDDA